MITSIMQMNAWRQQGSQ